VAYLDKETAAIDAAIAQQQRMIDLLNERKQIIIQQAVTKGLAPNAKMKDSGIDWIGQIPEGWHTRLLKRICKIKTGRTPSTTNSKYFDGDINWYTPGDLNDFALQTSVRHVTEKAKNDQACEVYPAQSVYLVGIGGTIGKVGYSEKESSCNQQINVIIPNEEIVFYKYLAYFLQLAKIDVLRNANLSTLPIISQNRMGEIYAICPPIDEQRVIVRIIEQQIKPIQIEQNNYQSLISLLRERKQIIINEVVTGKIKV
ncbi:MAG: restriction endonuclease subunit S, partial [Prevotellaceae bacterium]|nr:restriction endonuclease subunit S [Candidatus Faecinaster equi]